MPRSFLAASGALAISLSLSTPSLALDPEFEALRAAARKGEAEQARKPAPPPAAKPTGPSLAAFIPAAPKGWKLRNNPHDDAEGLVDLTRQASGRYVQASGSGGPALEITILAKSDLIGGGVPKLGKDPMSGSDVSEVSIAGHVGYMSWQAASNSGKLTFSIGRYQVLVAGRQATPQMLSQFASLVNLARLKAT